MGPKTLPTIWGTYMKLVAKYQISAINSCWEKCDEKWAYMFNVYSNYWWQRSGIWSQASYRYPISWEAFLDPSDSYFLFADLVGFYTHWTYMPIFSHIFLSNYCWQKSDIWPQASCRYPISWEVFFYPSDSYFLFAQIKSSRKWLKIVRVMIKRVLIFLEGIVCKHLLVWDILLLIYFHFLKYIPEK
jgi:hypothetical protein